MKKQLACHAILAALLAMSANVTAASPKPVAMAEQGEFFIGGKDVERNGSTIRVQSMFVEYRIPERRTKKTPVVLVHGNYQSGVGFTSTPDGRPGWADYMLRQGYAVYIVDQPMRGRSPYHPETDGVRTMVTARQVENLFTAPAGTSPVAQTRLHTQWPGSGRYGDAIFDQFYAGLQPTVVAPNETVDTVVRSALGALLQRIGPSILLTHSRAGPFGWEVADDLPELVRAIVAVEPNGPPFHDAQGADGKAPTAMARPWGITYDKMTFYPEIRAPQDLQIEQEAAPQAKNLVRCWSQKAPARQLPRLAKVPVMVVIGQASYHAPYDHCTARFLSQAGVDVTLLRLEDVGIVGNGHLMMLERNSDTVARRIVRWMKVNSR